jgi:hypothetical protein
MDAPIPIGPNKSNAMLALSVILYNNSYPLEAMDTPRAAVSITF